MDHSYRHFDVQDWINAFHRYFSKTARREREREIEREREREREALIPELNNDCHLYRHGNLPTSELTMRGVGEFKFVT